MLFLLDEISYSLDEKIVNEHERFLDCNLKDYLSTINVNGNDSLWCFGKDKAFYLRLGRLPANCLNRSLLLLAGDIAINPGPSWNFAVEQYRDWNMYKSKLSILYANARSIVNKDDLLQIKISNHTPDFVIPKHI